MLSSASILTEDHVVEAVCGYLVASGYSIVGRCTTRDRGDDIVAERAGTRLSIEAKGATSARTSSKRFGKPFESADLKVNIAEAVYRAVQVLSRAPTGQSVRAGIALPANPVYQREVATVAPMLRQLGISVFWVHGPTQVEEQ
jgi:hypothetical protein